MQSTSWLSETPAPARMAAVSGSRRFAHVGCHASHSMRARNWRKSSSVKYQPPVAEIVGNDAEQRRTLGHIDRTHRKDTHEKAPVKRLYVPCTQLLRVFFPLCVAWQTPPQAPRTVYSFLCTRRQWGSQRARNGVAMRPQARGRSTHCHAVTPPQG